MIQLVDYCGHGGKADPHVLGKGQRIETEMARNTGTKVFRVYQPAWNGNSRRFFENDIDELVRQIKEWYNSSKKRQSRCDIRFSYF